MILALSVLEGLGLTIVLMLLVERYLLVTATPSHRRPGPRDPASSAGEGAR